MTDTQTVVSLPQRIRQLESRLDRLIDGIEFAANEIRPQFGQAHLARVLDAIVREARK